MAKAFGPIPSIRGDKEMGLRWSGFFGSSNEVEYFAALLAIFEDPIASRYGRWIPNGLCSRLAKILKMSRELNS
jgi:hypothetical protein